MEPVMQRGDLVFCRSPRFVSRFIRLVDGGNSSHVALAVSDTHIVEATAGGVLKRPISEWPDDVEIKVFTPIMDDEDREDVAARAEHIAGDGWSYGWASFAFMWVYWLTGGKLAISAGAKAAVCSALASDCLHAGGEYFPKHSLFMTPSDLENFYGIEL